MSTNDSSGMPHPTTCRNCGSDVLVRSDGLDIRPREGDKTHPDGMHDLINFAFVQHNCDSPLPTATDHEADIE